MDLVLKLIGVFCKIREKNCTIKFERDHLRIHKVCDFSFLETRLESFVGNERTFFCHAAK